MSAPQDKTSVIHSEAGRERIHVTVGGAVQGVGFRPFVYRVAHEEHLDGWVCNTPEGVEIEVEGDTSAVESFLARLSDDAPAHSRIRRCEVNRLDSQAGRGFSIMESRGAGIASVIVQPDLATCPLCIAEISDHQLRRYRYPFTNCTHCGPRYSIIEHVPYDRASTTMRHFTMCAQCSAEYHDPIDRRFHAQPIACPDCGPQLEFWDKQGQRRSTREDALQSAAAGLREGKIVAVKGIGGFHLVVDARDAQAVSRLRLRKHRSEKPFALMVLDLAQARDLAEISELEREVLVSAAAPIVLLAARANGIAPSVAPGNPLLGIMLASNPLHHLLLHELRFPVVATSGNLSDEPLCTDEAEAYERLHSIADSFLVHNRPIARPLDDSIVRVAAGDPMLLRVGRGYAPLHMPLEHAEPGILATGAHQKCTVAVSLKDEVVVGQHLGDLDSALSVSDHNICAQQLPEMYECPTRITVCDLHPDYASTHYAQGVGVPFVQVQHHYAHALACAAENELELPALAVTWDGTGYGTDGTSWGGEFLRVKDESFERIAHLRTFPLPGGDAASRDPRRACFGLLHEHTGPDLATRVVHSSGCMPDHEIRILAEMVHANVNTPLTSSVGRLFDAIAFLLGLRCRASFEGQAAMDVEFAAFQCDVVPEPYIINVLPGRDGAQVLDWSPMITEILRDVRDGKPISEIAARFHETLAVAIVNVARLADEKQVLLTGGCFQNARLLERAIALLRDAGFKPYWHRLVPPNDNSIAFGQLAAAIHARRLQSLATAEVN